MKRIGCDLARRNLKTRFSSEMGCGASKSAQVDECAITINKDQDRSAREIDAGVEKTEDAKSEGVLSQPGTTTDPPSPQQQNDSVPQSTTSLPSPIPKAISLPQPNQVPSHLPKPIAYEIPLNEDGKPMTRKPFARRLEVRNMI